MKTIALCLICFTTFAGTSDAWCPQRSQSFVFNASGGFRGRIAQRQLSRQISSQIRLQNSFNQLAIAQSFVAPQVIQQRFVVPQVSSFVAPSYVQQAPQQAPAQASSISGVTEQLRQLSEMSEALRALKASP